MDEGGTGGGGWGHLQDAVHMVAARLGFEKAMVGTGRASPLGPPNPDWTGLQNPDSKTSPMSTSGLNKQFCGFDHTHSLMSM